MDLTRCWKVSPGYQGSLWDEFLGDGVFAVGNWQYDDLSDVHQYRSMEEAKALAGASHAAASMLWAFYKEMAIGDYLFAYKQGNILSMGRVTGPCEFVGEHEYFDGRDTHFRTVDWLDEADTSVDFNDDGEDDGGLYSRLKRRVTLFKLTPADADAIVTRLCDEHPLLADRLLDETPVANPSDAGVLLTSEETAIVKARRGQRIVRAATLENYGGQCALCDISDREILIAGHIDRWADNAEARGSLDNVVLMCRFHDTLFEYGYISLSDDLQVLRNTTKPVGSFLQGLLDATTTFRQPTTSSPNPVDLRKHRDRHGFSAEYS